MRSSDWISDVCSSDLINPVARRPWRRDSGDVDFPHALAGREFNRSHAATLADGENAALIDRGRSIYVGKHRHRGCDTRSSKRILPHRTAVLDAPGADSARRIAVDTGITRNSRLRGAPTA